MEQPFISKSCQDEKCVMCNQPASHKIAEVILHDDPNPNRHELTSYICSTHFEMIFGLNKNDK